MGLNCVIDWEKEKRIDDDLRDGKYIFVGKAKPVKYVGTVADFLKERTDAEFKRLLEKTKKNSVEISVEVAKAVSRTLPLRSQRVEVVKSAENVEKPLILELPKIALHGENSVLRKLMNWRVLRGLLVENVG
jgi:hypothetical protein